MEGVALLLGTHAQAQPRANVDMKRLLNADTGPSQWMSHSRTFNEQYLSPLDRIKVMASYDEACPWCREPEALRQWSCPRNSKVGHAFTAAGT